MPSAKPDSEVETHLGRDVVARQELARSAVRERLLSVAKLLFARQGYDATSLQDVLRVTDVAEQDVPPALGGKLQLLQGIFAEEWKTMGPRLEDAVLEALDARQSLLRIFAALINIFDKDRALAQLWLFEGRARRRENGETLVPDCFTEFSTLVTRLVARSQMEKTCPPDFEPRVVASLLVGSMEGLIREWLLSEQAPRHGTAPRYPGARLITVFDAAVSGLKP